MKAAHILLQIGIIKYTLLGVRNTYTALYSIIHIHKMNHIYYAHNNLWWVYEYFAADQIGSSKISRNSVVN